MADRPHARLAPSSAAMWARCPLSPTMVEEYGEDDDNEYSAEGTILHEVMERCLVREVEPYRFVGQVFRHGDFELEITEEHADMLAEGIDMIDAIPGKLYVEKRVRLDRWMPGQFGTLDVGIIGKRRITIWDNKFGMVPVSPVENYQLRLYALGFWESIARHETDVTDFRLVVWQPRVSGGGGFWDTTLDELLEFGVEMKFAAKKTEDPNPTAVPGPIQCEYCPGAKSGKCSAYHQYMLNLVVHDFDDLDANIEDGVPMNFPRYGMTPERRSYILEHRAMISKWLERLHAEAIDDALAGRPVPGRKLVLGRHPPRKWKDRKIAEERLRELVQDRAYNLRLKTPTQVEEELGPRVYEEIVDLVDKGEPKPILVDERDARPAIPSLIDLFDD